MTTDQTARARIAAALSPMTVVGGCPPQLLVPVLDASNPRMARIADWQPLDALVEALLAAVSVPPPPPARSATRGLSVPHRDALWDAVAPPGPARPTFPEQHERVCRAVAEILDEVAPPVPAADRAAVLSEAAQRLYTALFPAVYADMGQKAAEGVNRAVSELRRLADEEQPAAEAPSDRAAYARGIRTAITELKRDALGVLPRLERMAAEAEAQQPAAADTDEEQMEADRD